MTQRVLRAALAASCLLSFSCSKGMTVDDAGTGPDAPDFRDGGFVCTSATAEACVGNFHVMCSLSGEFFTPHYEDCEAEGRICVDPLWCVVCRPGAHECHDSDAVVCRDDGSGWNVIQTCDLTMGEGCVMGDCVNLCDQATLD